MAADYDVKRARYCKSYCHSSKTESTEEGIRHSPFVSLAIQCATDTPRSPASKPLSDSFASASLADTTTTDVARALVLPQYGLLGFDLGNNDKGGNAEPILLNTNTPSSVFLYSSRGSGKSYTFSCMLENHLLRNTTVGVRRETTLGFVFHYDTSGAISLAEAASFCSRGIKVRVLVS